MGFIPIKDPPEFTTQVEQWTRETDADGEQMAKEVIEPLLNNDIYLKEHLEELDGNAVKDGDKGAPGGVATLGENGKLVQRFFDAHILSRLFLTSIFPVKCFGC